MSRTILLALLVCSRVVLAQNVTLPYNPDANQDSVIGTPDLLEFLPYFGGTFTPGEVLIDEENLTDYVAFLEAAAANATSDTITIPMMPGTEPGEMLYWNGEQWFLVPTGESGDALILSGATPTWKALKLGCTDDGYIEFDPEATIEDGSCEIVAIPGCTVQGSCNFDPDATQNDGTCVAQQNWWIDSDGDGLGDTESFDVTQFLSYSYQPALDCEASPIWPSSVPGDSCYDLLALNFDDPANGPCEYEERDCQPLEYHGYTYQTIQIGAKCWFAENLRTEQWRDGSFISTVNSVEDWNDPVLAVTYYGEGDSECLAPPNWLDYDPCSDEQEVVDQFGRLYTLGAAYSDYHGGLCPAGWGIGTFSDWNSMLSQANSQSLNGDDYPIQEGEWMNGFGEFVERSDATGFAALPGGFRDVESGYQMLGFAGKWWGGNEGYEAYAASVVAHGPGEGVTGIPTYSEARSVRCVQVTVGCTDNYACNFDANAVDDDGTCEYLTCDAAGCTIEEACNYNPVSLIDNGTCIYPEMGYDCAGNCLPLWLDTLGNCVIDTMECGGGPFSEAITPEPLSAGDIVQYDFDAIGELSAVVLTVNWTSFADSWPGDLSLLLVSPQGESLLIKGTDSPFPPPIDHIESLPGSWNVQAPGEYQFSSSGYGLSGFGVWQLRVGCGYGTDVPFEFTLDLQGLCVFSDFMVMGCTNPDYTEYDASANTDDGSCITEVVNGCTDSNFIEYNASSNTDDGSCVTAVVNGCTDANYIEYNASANIDDGSCATAVVNGCTDANYIEYNASANLDDGSCTTLIVNGCTDPVYTEFDASANIDDGSCATITGCTNPDFIEYDVTANTDDGSCATLAGCSDSDVVSMDGYNYSLTTIGDQCWFAENLRTTAYADGTVIPLGLTDGEWMSATAGASAVYGEGSSECDGINSIIDACDESLSLAEYGRLYNWHAVADTRGLCPTGWHVPTDEEWMELEDHITSQGFDGTEGIALKSTMGWPGDGIGGNGTDDFGFSALPGGYRFFFNGEFVSSGAGGFMWSSSSNGEASWLRVLLSYSSEIDRNDTDPRDGFSVRCLRDSD